MTAREFQQALGATLPLDEWTDDMALGDWPDARRNAYDAKIGHRSARAVVWYLGPQNFPRRALQSSESVTVRPRSVKAGEAVQQRAASPVEVAS